MSSIVDYIAKQKPSFRDIKDQEKVNYYISMNKFYQENIFQQAGFSKTFNEGKALIEDLEIKFKETEKFKELPIFHVSQIREAVREIGLKDGNLKDYCGMLDENFNQKILDFKNKYKISIDESNTVLVATNSSFEIGADPKCCLLFYRINNEYFCLVHQWGEEMLFNKITNMSLFHSERIYNIGILISILAGATAPFMFPKNINYIFSAIVISMISIIILSLINKDYD